MLHIQCPVIHRMELQFHQNSGMCVWPLAMPQLTSAIYIQFPLGAEWQTAVAYNKTLSLSLSLTYIPLSTSQCARAYRSWRSSSHQCLSCSLLHALINNLTNRTIAAMNRHAHTHTHTIELCWTQ